MRPRLNAVRETLAHTHDRCPACTRIIRPGQKTDTIGNKRYHRACARYERKEVK